MKSRVLMFINQPFEEKSMNVALMEHVGYQDPFRAELIRQDMHVLLARCSNWVT